MARILIVDDDEAVRKATMIVLEAGGFEVDRIVRRLLGPAVVTADAVLIHPGPVFRGFRCS